MGWVHIACAAPRIPLTPKGSTFTPTVHCQGIQGSPTISRTSPSRPGCGPSSREILGFFGDIEGRVVVVVVFLGQVEATVPVEAQGLQGCSSVGVRAECAVPRIPREPRISREKGTHQGRVGDDLGILGILGILGTAQSACTSILGYLWSPWFFTGIVASMCGG